MDHATYLHIKKDTLRKVRAEYATFWSFSLIYYITFHTDDILRLKHIFQSFSTHNKV